MSDSEEDEELIKEAIRQNQREKYGADTKEGIQQCIEYHDLRKVYDTVNPLRNATIQTAREVYMWHMPT